VELVNETRSIGSGRGVHIAFSSTVAASRGLKSALRFGRISENFQGEHFSSRPPDRPYHERAMKNSGPIILSELISPASINLNLKSHDRESVLSELVGQIPEITDQPEARQKLIRALQEREQLYSTGIGDGIALPHARNALVGLVDKPVIVFGRHTPGIPYGAVDGLPARLFFLLVAPTVTQHLAVLARVSRLLREPTVRQQLLQADTSKKALTVIREGEALL
jgi:mannitol/fructose-specific phosphotransferase system IIA component (Ntr-type)